MTSELSLHQPAHIADYLREPQRLRRDAEWCGISSKFCDLITQAANELLRRPDRLTDLARCATAIFESGAWKPEDWHDTPRDASQGERFFLILPLLQHLPIIRAWYAQHGIPESILLDTLADLQLWIETHVQRAGQPKFCEVGWMREHFCGRVIRLGRLQFQPSTYSLPFTVLDHKKTGATRIVAHSGRSITAQGIFADSEGADGPAIELTCTVVDGEIRAAHLVQPDGYIATTSTIFEPGAWQPRLSPGDAVLGLHIPAGAPLAFDACQASFREADTFFPRYFSERPAPRGVICGSWLFYPGLCDILPPEANIVRFQRAFHRVPLPGATSNQTYERALSPYGRAITREQLQGTLQHRLFAHIQAGNVPINAGGIMLAPLKDWGGAPTLKTPIH